MPVKSSIRTYPISWLISQNKSGRLNKNISIQRKEVWDAVKKGNLIAAILLDVPLESLLFEDLGNRTYNVLDGKQRTLTFCSFMEDGFALSPKIHTKEINGVQLAGKRYSDLPETLQSRIADYQLSISMLDELESEERAMIFFMRNQAAPLTKMDLSPVVLGETAMKNFELLCKHPFITGKVKPTPANLRKRDDLKIILQYLILRTEQNWGFSGMEIMSICDDIRNGEMEIEAEKIIEILDYLNEALPAKRAYLKNIHLPIIMFTASKAREKKIPASEFGIMLDDFFILNLDDAEFKEACKQGSANKTNVNTRLKIMSKILDMDNGELK